MTYQPLSVVALALHTDEATLIEFGRKLTDEQIGVVLSNQQPPYSAEKVEQILASHGKPSRK